MAGVGPTHLEGDAERFARELITRGVTFVPLPQEALDQALKIFEHISQDGLAEAGEEYSFEPLGTWPPLPSLLRRHVLPKLPVRQLNFFIGTQANEEDEEKETEFIRYANATQPETLAELTEPFAGFLEPVTRRLFGREERVMIVNAQYIFGNAMKVTEAHRDFFSRNTISLLTPLYDYTPEEASLYYWRFDENPELYTSLDLARAQQRRKYAYRKGEAVVFSGDLFHQTVPFDEPEAGWGRKQCRALFCLVLVAADAVQREEQYELVLKNMRGPAGGYMVDPATEEWLTPPTSDSEEDEPSEHGLLGCW